MNYVSCDDGSTVVLLDSGHQIIISTQDIWIIETFPLWFLNVQRGYVYCHRRVETEFSHINEALILHRLVCGVTKKNGVVIDHKNRNKLDNRRENLRFASNQDNMRNKSSSRGSSSALKGVIKVDRVLKKPFAAHMKIGTKTRNLGYYSSEEEAACVYDLNAIIHHEDFAYLNFPNFKPTYLELAKEIGLTKDFFARKTSSGHKVFKV